MNPGASENGLGIPLYGRIHCRLCPAWRSLAFVPVAVPAHIAPVQEEDSSQAWC